MLSSTTNHDVININNHYNFFYTWMNKLDISQRKDFIETMRLIIGRTFCENFRMYIYSKIPGSVLLEYF